MRGNDRDIRGSRTRETGHQEAVKRRQDLLKVHEISPGLAFGCVVRDSYFPVVIAL